MAGYAGYDEYAEAEQHAPTWFLILLWLGWVVVTIAGYLAGRWLSESIATIIVGQTEGTRVLSIEGRVEAAGAVSYVVAVVGGVVAGAALGILQGLLLIPLLKVAGALEWLLATVIGRAVQSIVVSVVALEMVGLTIDQTALGLLLLFAFLAVTGILSGLALGYPQSVVLKERTQRSREWIVANLIGPVTTSLVLALTLVIATQDTIRDNTALLTAILTALATGFALLEILRHPREGAEWQKLMAWRRAEEVTPPVDNSALGSALYTPRPDSAARSTVPGPEPGAETKARVP